LSKDFEWCLRNVDRHAGPPEDFAARLRIAAQRALEEGRDGVLEFSKRMIRWIAFDANLNLAYEHLRTQGGTSPGPDDMTFDDFARKSERFQYLRGVSSDIRQHRYQSGPTRAVQVPKGSGKGYRTIEIQNLEDRLVHRAITQVVQPILDPQFDKHSFGFRPNLSRFDALAVAEGFAVKEKRRVWVTEDIRDAFPSVPLNPLLETLSHYLPARNLRNLIENAILTGRKRGLIQGSPLSPLLLNLYLHHHLDRRWQKLYPSIPLIRWADDIALLCRTVREAQQARAKLEEVLIPAGMPLKGTAKDSVRRLAKEQPAFWLGYAIEWKQGCFNVALAANAMERLVDNLGLVAWEPNAGVLAEQVIRGWLTQAGPVFQPSRAAEACKQIVAQLQEARLGETRVRQPGAKPLRLACTKWMLADWEHAHQIWLRKRDEYLRRSAIIASAGDRSKKVPRPRANRTRQVACLTKVARGSKTQT
jgi:RNA-directed DNA polymerase